MSGTWAKFIQCYLAFKNALGVTERSQLLEIVVSIGAGWLSRQWKIKLGWSTLFWRLFSVLKMSVSCSTLSAPLSGHLAAPPAGLISPSRLWLRDGCGGDVTAALGGARGCGTPRTTVKQLQLSIKLPGYGRYQCFNSSYWFEFETFSIRMCCRVETWGIFLLYFILEEFKNIILGTWRVGLNSPTCALSSQRL